MRISFLRSIFAMAGLGLILTASAYAQAPAGRYTTSGATVYDKKTNLTWQRTLPTTQYSWADAKTYCGSAAVSTILGGTGRLPTVKELSTIVDYWQSPGPAVDATAFPSTPTGVFWSSSPLAGSASSAWGINFTFGNAATESVSLVFNVRCVR